MTITLYYCCHIPCLVVHNTIILTITHKSSNLNQQSTDTGLVKQKSYNTFSMMTRADGDALFCHINMLPLTHRETQTHFNAALTNPKTENQNIEKDDDGKSVLLKSRSGVPLMVESEDEEGGVDVDGEGEIKGEEGGNGEVDDGYVDLRGSGGNHAVHYLERKEQAALEEVEARSCLPSSAKSTRSRNKKRYVYLVCTSIILRTTHKTYIYTYTHTHIHSHSHTHTPTQQEQRPLSSSRRK